MKKTLSAKILLLITVISYLLSFLIIGIIGDTLKFLAAILVVMTIIAFVREKNGPKSEKK